MNREACPFCAVEPEREFIVESEVAFAIYDKFPVSPGHTLIIPRRHVESLFELSLEEQAACISLLNGVQKLVDASYQPEGYNVGINVGEAAGQTVGHVHIHLIPRYTGDVDTPRGGVRGVIPSKQNY